MNYPTLKKHIKFTAQRARDIRAQHGRHSFSYHVVTETLCSQLRERRELLAR